MKKILYLMHIDWLWIRQRPHFIAEELADSNFVIVLYRPHLKKFKVVITSNFLAIPMFPIPRRNSILESIDNFMNGMLVKAISAIVKLEFAYLTSPAMFCYLGRSKMKIIYDCMDDLAEFSQVDAKREKIQNLEFRVIQESSLTVFSSEHLSKVVKGRYKFDFRYLIIRNGISSSMKVSQDALKDSSRMRYIYFGTIAEWFDFDSILYALRELENLEIILYGPSIVKIPDHPRLIYMGQRSHSNLMDEVKSSYGYIMPFIINDLVRSVDPVKIYEYIALGKRIIVADYPELEHFGNLINRYTTPDSLVELILGIDDINDKYHERQEFISRSSWKRRVGDMEKVINEL